MVRLGRCRSSSSCLRRLRDQMVDMIPYLLLDNYLDGIPDSLFFLMRSRYLYIKHSGIFQRDAPSSSTIIEAYFKYLIEKNSQSFG